MTRKKVLIFGVSFVFIVSFLITIEVLIFEPDEIGQCKEFIIDNANVRDLFGTIESIKPRFIGSGRHKSTKKGVSGYYSFRVKGSKRKNTIKAKWQQHNDKINVTQISMRKGLASTSIIWPKSETELNDYLLPSYMWDGIILLGLAFLNLLFHLSAKKNGKLARFCYPSMLRIGSMTAMSWGFLIVSCGCVVYSILCFFNICTLF
jgi:hypothetical protein